MSARHRSQLCSAASSGGPEQYCREEDGGVHPEMGCRSTWGLASRFTGHAFLLAAVHTCTFFPRRCSCVSTRRNQPFLLSDSLSGRHESSHHTRKGRKQTSFGESVTTLGTSVSPPNHLASPFLQMRTLGLKGGKPPFRGDPASQAASWDLNPVPSHGDAVALPLQDPRTASLHLLH